jgi:RNA polymerase sigma factor (sigma-70 family)
MLYMTGEERGEAVLIWSKHVDMGVDGSPDLASVCREQYPRLVGILGLYVGDAHVAEELAQDVLVQLCRQWEQTPLDSPEAWLYRVAMNRANSFFRRKLAERRARQRLSESQVAGDAQMGSIDEAIAVRHAVSALPPRERTALVLRYYLDLPVREAARVMKCPEGTVKTLCRRAILMLRHTVGEVQAEED